MKKYYCSIRFDDVCPGMKTEYFDAICSELEKKNVFALLGVVPENHDKKLEFTHDEAFWEKIKKMQERGYLISQHGTYHEYVTKDGGLLGRKKDSEFAGLTYEEQYDKLKKGQDILKQHGIFADNFMAPSNSYDLNTIKAAKELGFKYFTAGWTDYPYEIEGIVFIPCSIPKYQVRGRINTISLHTNTMKEKHFKKLLCAIRRGKIVSFDKLIELVPETIKEYDAKSEKKNMERANRMEKIKLRIKKLLGR